MKELLSQPDVSNFADIDQTDVHLYLKSAERFAETSIEAVALISKRAAPEVGLEAKLRALSLTLEKELQPYPDLWLTLSRVRLNYKDYLTSRQRFQMQSALNALNELRFGY